MPIHTIDLTPLYLRCLPEEQWEAYENAYPSLFRHYYLHWAEADAKYVSQEFARRWYAQCRMREGEMLRRVLAEWEVSRKENDWFMMWDETDVTRYRGGYYVGLRLMQEIHRRYKFGLKGLLSLPAKELEKLVLKVLPEMAETTAKQPSSTHPTISR